MRFRTVAALIGITCLALFAIACSDDDDNSGGNNQNNNSQTIKIGALLPLTGSLASYGETSQAALKDAVANLDSSGNLQLVVKDTRSQGDAALDQLRALQSEGVRIVIGPYSSTEVNAVKQYADQNGLILVSPLSTATSLAIPNDNVFRFTPDDAAEGVATAALIYADGIRTIIPVNRDDPGNQGLKTEMQSNFERLGGRVVGGVTYGPNETNFTNVTNQIKAIYDAQPDKETTGIYLAAFNEVVALFRAASAVEGLNRISWYGSDSVAQIRELVEDQVAAAFAVDAYYPNPILGLSDADRAKWGPVSERVQRDIGRAPDAFALAAYDALNVAYTVLREAGANPTIETLKQNFVSTANNYSGLTGSTRLNAAGDRAQANYDFWGVCRNGNNFQWVRVATFTASASGGSATRIGC